jgi:hypothetical protein
MPQMAIHHSHGRILLCTTNIYATPLDDDCDLQLDKEEWLTPEEVAKRQYLRSSRKVPRSESTNEADLAAPSAPTSTPPKFPSGPVIDLTLPREGEFPKTPVSDTKVKFKSAPPLPEPEPEPPNSGKRVSFANARNPLVRRSKRVRNAPKRFVPENFIGTYSELLAKNLVAHSARVQYASDHSHVDVEYIAFLLTDWEQDA